MVVDFTCDDGLFERLALPGCSLAHGFMGRLDQVLFFVLWYVFLISGPEGDRVGCFLGRVRSTTADMGSELHLVDCVELSRAWFERMRGNALAASGSLINRGARLLPPATRISGWNHSCSTTVKRVVLLAPKWPEWSAKLRDVCRCFRSASYRQRIWRSFE
ncbi:unnamed protein product, partial [Prorocentrum cordatum]